MAQAQLKTGARMSPMKPAPRPGQAGYGGASAQGMGTISQLLANYPSAGGLFANRPTGAGFGQTGAAGSQGPAGQGAPGAAGTGPGAASGANGPAGQGVPGATGAPAPTALDEAMANIRTRRGTERDKTIGRIRRDRGDMLDYYGLKPAHGFDADDGLVADPVTGKPRFIVDTSTPTSRAMLLQRSYTGAREQSRETLGARGHARSGVTKKRAENLGFDEQVAFTGLEGEVMSTIRGAIADIGAANTGYETGVLTDRADWIATVTAALRGGS